MLFGSTGGSGLSFRTHTAGFVLVNTFQPASEQPCRSAAVGGAGWLSCSRKEENQFTEFELRGKAPEWPSVGVHHCRLRRCPPAGCGRALTFIFSNYIL